MKYESVSIAIFAVASVLMYSQFVSAVEPQIFMLDLEFNNGSFSVNDVIVKSASWPGQVIDQTIYQYSMVSFENNELYSSKFEVPDYIVEEGIGITFLEKVNFTLIVPYFPNAKDILLLGESNVTLLNIDVSLFAVERPGAPLSYYVIILSAIGAIIVVSIVLFILRRYGENGFAMLKRKYA